MIRFAKKEESFVCKWIHTWLVLRKNLQLVSILVTRLDGL